MESFDDIIKTKTSSLCKSRKIKGTRSRDWLNHVFGRLVRSKSDKTKINLIDRMEKGRIFDVDRFSSYQSGEIFHLKSLIRSPMIVDSVVYNSLVEWCPSQSGVYRGAHELFLCFMIKGAHLNNSDGDVFVPGIGNIEVKSIKDYSSSIEFTGSKSNTYGGVSSINHLITDTCSSDLISFGYDNLKEFFSKAEDTDAHGTAIAEVMNVLFTQERKAADNILTKGFVKRLRSSAREGKDWKKDITREIYLPLVSYAFNYYKHHDNFDRLLLINRKTDRAVFIDSPHDILFLYLSGDIVLHPSKLSMKSNRGNSIGISLR